MTNDEAIEMIRNDMKLHHDSLSGEYRKALRMAISALSQPQRMRGKWINVTKTGGAELWKCSECGELELEDSYFCPNCGSDNRGEDDE